MKRIIKHSVLAIFSVAILALISAVAIKSTNVRADENNFKKSVSEFCGKHESEIVKLNEVSLEKDKKNTILSDGDYLYNVNFDGSIKSIVKKHRDEVKTDAKISKDIAKDEAAQILKKLYINFKKFSTEIQANNNGYTIQFKEKIADDINTGNFIFIDLGQNGQLEGATVCLENTNINIREVKISKEDA
jgi:uncharacterized protein YuzE